MSTSLSADLKRSMVQLLEPNFIRQLFDTRLAQYYPEFQKIEQLAIEPYKKHLGTSGAVLVLHYAVDYLARDGSKNKLEIFVSAHSDGSRQGAYQKNQYLYEHGFNSGPLRVTKPLFYLEEPRAYFYQAARGRRLVSFFAENPQTDLRPVLSLLAAWLKKLHGLDYKTDALAWPKFSIAKMIPAPVLFIPDFGKQNPDWGELVQTIYDQMISLENLYSRDLKSTLVYGDNHPENVIIENLNTDHLEMIDFNDVALGDPLLDLGTFLQQFDFMSHPFISRSQIHSYKTNWLQDYFGPGRVISAAEISRINLYQAWTALRSAVFIFYMKENDDSLLDLLRESQRYLEMAENQRPTVNLE